ncbi:unnamed protein product [Calypogeia fissa]
MAVAVLRRGSMMLGGSYMGRSLPSVSDLFPASSSSLVAAPSSSKFRLVTTAAAQINNNTEYVIVGGGNAAGYAAKAFVDSGVAEGKVCIVGRENVVPYERPTLTKGYLFPLDKNPPRLPGFHTTVGSGGERQTPEWYKEHGIEVHHGTTVTGLNIADHSLTTSSGDTIKYEKLIIATGSGASMLPEKIGGRLPGVHYIREVADADSLIDALKTAKKVVVIGGGYIGLEVAAALTAWEVDVTLVFPDKHVMPRLFTPTIAKLYEELLEKNEVKIFKGTSVSKLIPGDSGAVAKVELANGTVLDADTVVVGIGAKPAAGPWLESGLKEALGAIEVDGLFRTSSPGIYAIGDVAAFPLRIYGKRDRVEHVDHARKSATHCVKSLLQNGLEEYDYLPFFYSRIFEYPGSTRKVWWQFYGTNVGEVTEVGKFDPKYAAFWVESGRVKGVFLESGSPEEFALLPKLARQQPSINISDLKAASTVGEALKLAEAALGKQPVGSA